MGPIQGRKEHNLSNQSIHWILFYQFDQPINSLNIILPIWPTNQFTEYYSANLLRSCTLVYVVTNVLWTQPHDVFLNTFVKREANKEYSSDLSDYWDIKTKCPEIPFEELDKSRSNWYYEIPLMQQTSVKGFARDWPNYI